MDLLFFIVVYKVNSEKFCFNNELIHKINKRRGMKLYEDDYLED